MASVVLVASAAWRAARVLELVASLWPPRVLALERAVVLSLPRAPAQALAVASMPRALARVLAFVPTRVLVLQGPLLVSTASARGTGALRPRTTTDWLLTVLDQVARVLGAAK